MQTDELDRLLAHTLSDHKLTRGEKRILSSTIAEFAGDDDHRRALVRSRAFEMARRELVGPDALAVLDWLEGVAKVLAIRPAEQGEPRSEAHFSPHGDCQGRINRLISHARRSIDICVFTITDDRITTAIEQAHRNKVAVRIITDNDKALDLGSDIARLKSAGIRLRTDKTSDHMHHKYAIFDETRLLTGSYNWTRSASTSNEENFIVTDDRELVQSFRRHFSRLWDELD